MPSSNAMRMAVAFGKLVATVLLLLWSLGPIVLLVRASLMLEKDVFASNQPIIPDLTFANYMGLPAQWPTFFTGLYNSAIITTGATVLAVLASTLAGYGYSRWRSRGLAISAFWLIALRLMPPIVLTLPLFPIVNYMRINDTHILLILLYAAFMVSLCTLVMRTVIDQIPRELDEAAVADGASPLQVFFLVILPLCKQGMIAIAVFVIVFSWNEYLFAFLFTSNEARTAPLAVSEMLASLTGTDWGMVFAATTLQLLPILIFIILTRDYLIKGVTAGGVKG